MQRAKQRQRPSATSKKLLGTALHLALADARHTEPSAYSISLRSTQLTVFTLCIQISRTSTPAASPVIRKLSSASRLAILPAGSIRSFAECPCTVTSADTISAAFFRPSLISSPCLLGLL